MLGDLAPLWMGLLILVASLISLRFGISVAIIEILLGVFAGNVGLITPQEWMLYISSYGGIFLTFLAGAETDIHLMRQKLKESLFIGLASFFMPLISVFLFTYYVAGWSFMASLLSGVALSETAVAVVYFVLAENDLFNTEVGKRLMAATFITNMGTALALSFIFLKPTIYTLLFFVISIIVIILANKYSHVIFDNKRYKNKVIEPEIKYIFFLLLVFMGLAAVGGSQAILPAFILGLFLGKHFVETSASMEVKKRMKTIAFAFITPIFFIVGGLKVSLPLVLTFLPIFLGILIIRQVFKFLGLYYVTRRYLGEDYIYSTLLLSTGLTFGLIASLFGLSEGYIDSVQYSLLTGVLIASAVIPTFIAQKWFNPLHSEDLIDLNVEEE